MLFFIVNHDASFNRSAGASPCPTDCAVSNIFSAKIAYPLVLSSSNTWVTAPISFPFCKIGLPDTSVSRGIQHDFYDDYFINFPLNAKKPHRFCTISLYYRNSIFVYTCYIRTNILRHRIFHCLAILTNLSLNIILK